MEKLSSDEMLKMLKKVEKFERGEYCIQGVVDDKYIVGILNWNKTTKVLFCHLKDTATENLEDFEELGGALTEDPKIIDFYEKALKSAQTPQEEALFYIRNNLLS